MKHYKMATVSCPSIIKQPLKMIEIPLNKFTEEVIPHHQRILEKHKAFVHKLIAVNNVEQLAREIKEKKRSVKQLRDLLYELDTLRTQVEDNDLDAFDTKTMPLRSAILKLTKAYQDLEKTADKLILKDDRQSPDERINPFEGASSIQIQADLNQLKLLEQQERLNRVEEIHKKSEDLQEIHKDLHKLVKEQGEQVDEVELNVESAQENIHSGSQNIARANRYSKINAVAYPATGAFVGTLIGGPIGMFAGLKVGGLAALGCAFVGYAGGKFLKKQKETDINDSDPVINNENNENHSTATENAKKDI